MSNVGRRRCRFPESPRRSSSRPPSGIPGGALYKTGEAAELLGWGRNTLTRKLKTLLPALADD
ncbi:helix-turn-helix domain-containing protein [Halomonas sp. H5]|uniref:helix-turn-helix domain-containing protein n=1 Tax=Halomonas sp. H5 TaxID=3423910 RepID=UPI003D3675EE